jgi:hypothetical protein
VVYESSMPLGQGLTRHGVRNHGGTARRRARDSDCYSQFGAIGERVRGNAMIETIPFSPRVAVPPTTDIAFVNFDGRILTVDVGLSMNPDGQIQALRVRFDWAGGFRYLDESHLIRYFNSKGFVRGHHVLEVLSGGWAAEQSSLEGRDLSTREWLIVTGNGCVSVFGAEPSLIETVVSEGS